MEAHEGEMSSVREQNSLQAEDRLKGQDSVKKQSLQDEDYVEKKNSLQVEEKREKRQKRQKRQGKIFRLLFFLCSFCLLMLFAFYVNRHIHIKALYMDDLYLFSFFREQDFLTFSFPIGEAVRFRPVYWALSYIEMVFVGNDPNRYWYFNVVLNGLLACFLCYFSWVVSKGKKIVSLSLSLIFLSAHFAYYQIAQALGILETLALGFSLITLYFLYQELNEEKHFLRNLIFSHIFFFLLVFTHERYIALLPLFYVPLLFRGRAGEAKILTGGKILPLAQAFLFYAIRKFAIGSFIPKGTGGTEVTDSFKLEEALQNAFTEVYYIFGFQKGPEHLNGIPWENVAENIRKLVYASIVVLGITVFLCLIFALIRIFKTDKSIGESTESSIGKSAESGTGNHSVKITANNAANDVANDATNKSASNFKKEQKRVKPARLRTFIGNNLLFLIFIAMCIGSSSVTIRVEMRWVYVSFAASLLYFSYLLGVSRLPLGTIFCLAFICLRIPVERYYRSYFPQIYFWEDQDRMNSLAEETIEKYGRGGVLGKQVYILENSYKMSKFYGDTFFQVFDEDFSGHGTKIHFFKDFRELPSEANSSNSIVLKEVPEERGYKDITQEVFPNL
ncbi:hypothetical protein [Oribacterium parvum]|uniref:hypothetical protein n=1 Tax=Oribacterium parvum TaxID=1501329 RepID=UPI003AB99018